MAFSAMIPCDNWVFCAKGQFNFNVKILISAKNYKIVYCTLNFMSQILIPCLSFFHYFSIYCLHLFVKIVVQAFMKSPILVKGTGPIATVLSIFFSCKETFSRVEKSFFVITAWVRHISLKFAILLPWNVHQQALPFYSLKWFAKWSKSSHMRSQNDNK